MELVASQLTHSHSMLHIMLRSGYFSRWLQDPQSRETVKYGHESRGTRNQEWLCWRGPPGIYQKDSKHQKTI
jgi:hypothetical protein